MSRNANISIDIPNAEKIGTFETLHDGLERAYSYVK
jgi:hypothetical protein